MTSLKIQLTSSRAENDRELPPPGRFRRIKTALGALLGTSVLIGFILAALLLGSVIATFLVILVVAAGTIVVLKVIIQQVRQKCGW